MQSKIVLALLVLACITSCKNDVKENDIIESNLVQKQEVVKFEFGFKLNDYIVVRDTIKKGDSFGEILERNKMGYPKIFNIVEKVKDTFDIRKLQAGKPYTLLFSKDSLQLLQCFIYQPNREEYVVIDFQDSITQAYIKRKPVKYIEKEASGVITSTISEALDEQGISMVLAYNMSDIYAWTIDFFRLQKGDRFKVIYTDKYIDDTIYAGIHHIKSAYFEHKNETFYAFDFETDSVKGLSDYFNEEAKNLRRAFLKAPVSYYKRISSRYNLRRRIAYYGNRVRPHKGTDFAADIGTPIMATANGTVVESTRKGGNGKYVKIRHNSTYSTQYLHMKNRNVKVGDFVKQGDVIGWVGMTGNTAGPHVCYRFWKNGVQVDPFRQKLPEAKPISEELKASYLKFIIPIKIQIDNIEFLEKNPQDKDFESLVTQMD